MDAASRLRRLGYLAFCEETGKVPAAPNPAAAGVTIRQDLQAQALRLAELHDRPLDAIVNDALKDYLAKTS